MSDKAKVSVLRVERPHPLGSFDHSVIMVDLSAAGFPRNAKLFIEPNQTFLLPKGFDAKGELPPSTGGMELIPTSKLPKAPNVLKDLHEMVMPMHPEGKETVFFAMSSDGYPFFVKVAAGDKSVLTGDTVDLRDPTVVTSKAGQNGFVVQAEHFGASQQYIDGFVASAGATMKQFVPEKIGSASTTPNPADVMGGLHFTVIPMSKDYYDKHVANLAPRRSLRAIRGPSDLSMGTGAEVAVKTAKADGYPPEAFDYSNAVRFSIHTVSPEKFTELSGQPMTHLPADPDRFRDHPKLNPVFRNLPGLGTADQPQPDRATILAKLGIKAGNGVEVDTGKPVAVPESGDDVKPNRPQGRCGGMRCVSPLRE